MKYTIKENTTYKLTEKKSKFITHLYKITSAEEANEILKQIKKEHRKANHNVYAYTLLRERPNHTQIQ